MITGAYQIPPALAGIDNSTGFSGEDLTEAYFVFNAITKSGRDTIESQLNRVLKNSVFNTKSIKINKLNLNGDEILADPNVKPETTEQAEANAVFADMSGKQFQGLQRAVRKYNKEEITKAQASQMLLGFGLTAEQINVWLDE